MSTGPNFAAPPPPHGIGSPDNVIPISEVSRSNREDLTSVVTHLMTASVIAKATFPSKKNLPPAVPPAFNSHGQLLHLDYPWMLQFLWVVIDDVKRAVTGWRHKRAKIRWISAAAALGIAAIAGIAWAGNGGDDVGVTFVCAILAFILWVFGTLVWRPTKLDLSNEIADIRALALRELLDGNNCRQIPQSIQSTISAVCYCSDGRLEDTSVPVLVVGPDDYPFPGYGRLQADTTFSCPPSTIAKSNPVDLNAVRECISERIKACVNEARIGNVTFGEVLVAHGWSILSNDILLESGRNGERVPILWSEKSNVENFEANTRASVRRFFAMEVLFPQYMTVATFFTRPFAAGNGMACQLAVSTLGPPVEGGGDIFKRLAKYESEKSGARHNLNDNYGDVGWSQLYSLRSNVRGAERFQVPEVDEDAIMELKVPDENYGKNYEAEIKKLLKESVQWPGCFARVRNWREENSYTFTTDFFGRPEAMATLRSLYVQISKAILDALECFGFDISGYKDKEGHYSINADKIDHLVVGEKIYMEKKTAQESKTSTLDPEGGKTAS